MLGANVLTPHQTAIYSEHADFAAQGKRLALLSWGRRRIRVPGNPARDDPCVAKHGASARPGENYDHDRNERYNSESGEPGLGHVRFPNLRRRGGDAEITMAHSEQVLHGLCPRQQASTLERPASARGMRRAVETSYRHYVVADLASHPSSDPARTHARQFERCSFVAALPLKRPPDARPSDCCCRTTWATHDSRAEMSCPGRFDRGREADRQSLLARRRGGYRPFLLPRSSTARGGDASRRA